MIKITECMLLCAAKVSTTDAKTNVLAFSVIMAAKIK